MEKNLNKVSVTILDDHYVLKGPEPEEYLEMLAAQANKRLIQVQNNNPRLSRIQVAILTALNLMDELNKLQQEHQHLIEMQRKSERPEKK